ncbi:MAG: endonuclease III [Planctomycetota bacterium]
MHEVLVVSRKAGRKKAAAICRRLGRVYGAVVAPERGPVLDELIATILSQNTSDANSHAAFEELCRRFGDWDAVRRAPVARIAGAIRRAGLANRKAPRIKAILKRIHAERGELSLEFLRSMPTPEAAAYLRGLDGVGPKTAACVLLFACRKPVLPVDTHVHRVSHRLGLIALGTDAARAHEELTPLVPASRVLEFHVQLIRHGRTRCSARNPKCEDCPLVDLCREGPKRLLAGQGRGEFP